LFDDELSLDFALDFPLDDPESDDPEPESLDDLVESDELLELADEDDPLLPWSFL